jgi:hypothetical protein
MLHCCPADSSLQPLLQLMKLLLLLLRLLGGGCRGPILLVLQLLLQTGHLRLQLYLLQATQHSTAWHSTAVKHMLCAWHRTCFAGTA